jgi:winged helix-turn-helix protein
VQGAESKSRTGKPAGLEEYTIEVHRPIFIKFHISSEILKIADKGVSKTKIMHGAYLLFTQLREYLKMLLDNVILDFDEETYSTGLPKQAATLSRCASA